MLIRERGGGGGGVPIDGYDEERLGMGRELEMQCGL